MTKFLLFFITTIIITGCAVKEAPHPTVENLKDVHYNIVDGKVVLTKTHILDANKSTSIKETVTTTQNPTYEKVPNFNKNNVKKYLSKQKNKFKEKKIKIQGNKAKVSVENIPVNEFIDLVFGKVLNVNYTVSDAVDKITNPITLNMSVSQTKQELFNVVKRLLQEQNIMIEKDNGVFFLSKTANVNSDSKRGLYVGIGHSVKESVPDEEKILMYIPLNYITTNQLKRLMRNAGLKLQYPSPNSSTFGLLGTAGDIRRALELITIFDSTYMNNKIPYIIKLENINVEDFTKRLTAILKTNSIPIATNMNEVGLVLSPISEINTLLVLSPQKSWLDLILYWKEKLDIEQEGVNKPKLYMYKVRNRKAKELAKVLNTILTKSVLSETDTPQKKKILNKNQKAKIEKAKENIKRKYKSSITFDLPTNTIMMVLLPSEYKALKPIIKQLDILPLQVLLEVTIAEVTLTDDFSLGFEYALSNMNLGKSVDKESTLTIGGSGLAYLYNSVKLNIAVDAFAQNQLLDIVSEPKMVVLNNETASMTVGTQVPTVTSETSATDIPSGSVNRNITYASTGVNVGITPVINSDGILTMNVALSLSEAQVNSSSSIDSPMIVNRALKTSVVMKSNQTIMLGGLIYKNNSTTDSGVPYLKDIPWLGSVFTNKSKKTVKTELVMMIRPVIIHTAQEMIEETKKYKAILNHVKSL